MFPIRSYYKNLIVCGYIPYIKKYVYLAQTNQMTIQIMI